MTVSSTMYNTNNEEFEALKGEYFDDDKSDVELGCGKECTRIFLLFTCVNYDLNTSELECTDEEADNSEGITILQHT